MTGGGILSGNAIHDAVATGAIAIDPYDPRHANPASYDLTLGTGVVVYDLEVYKPLGQPLRPLPLDAKAEPRTRSYAINDAGWVLHPGQLYLMHTVERVATTRYVPVLDGKSSIGRLGICVHLTAGYGDPGVDGQYTLEVTAVHPVRVYAGMRFAQIRFHTLVGDGPLYRGQYAGETARGAVPSRSWRQFAKKETLAIHMSLCAVNVSGRCDCDGG